MANDPADNPEPLSYRDPRKGKLSGNALVSMILGILAIPLDFVFCSGMLVGIIAIVTGILAAQDIKQSEATEPKSGKAFAIAGIILGAVSILLGIGCGVLLFHA